MLTRKIKKLLWFWTLWTASAKININYITELLDLGKVRVLGNEKEVSNVSFSRCNGVWNVWMPHAPL